jgi:hypothetical protein
MRTLFADLHIYIGRAEFAIGVFHEVRHLQRAVRGVAVGAGV